MTSVLERRRAATQKTYDRFNGQRLDWRRFDCVRMAAFQARALGHAVALSRFGRWRSQDSARARLEALGFPTLVEAVDSLGFARLAWAAHLPGDLVCIANDPDQDWQLGALYVALGNGRALGFAGGVCQAVQLRLTRPDAVRAAWRVNPHA